MLLTASRTSPSARLLQTRAAGSSALTSSVSLQSRCGSQTREFCFGAWSSTSSESRQSRQRHRTLRYRYTESLNRNISWENNPKAAIKKAMAGFGRPVDPSKHANVKEAKPWLEDLVGIRPGKNIEDVERSAIDHLIRGDEKANIRKTTFNNMHHFVGRPDAKIATPKNVLKTATKTEDDTFIDPITNRRTSIMSSMARAAARDEAMAAYQPTDFVDVTAEADSAPEYQDLDQYVHDTDRKTNGKPVSAPKYNDLNKYEPVIDERPATEDSPKYEDLDNYGPVKWNEPDGRQKPTLEEDSKDYKDLHKYSATQLDDPFTTQRQLTPEEQSKLYDDLDQYRPVHWNEPDGLRKQSTEELSKNYDDLHKYGAVQWNEPNGLREPTPEELSKSYKDLNAYEPVAWSEPDGLRRLTPEEESKKYDDLELYEAPFEVSKSILEAHEKSQMDATPRGKPLAAKVDAPVEDFARKYNDLGKYGPVRWNEPDGLRQLTPEELSKNYDDLHLYGAVRWNEPDGLRRLTPEEQSKNYHDTRLYAPRDLSPRVARVHPEESSKMYKDLTSYHHFDNADVASPRVQPEEASKQYKDLNEYPAAGYEEPNFQQVHPEELTQNYADLGSYELSGFVSQAQAYPAHPEEASKVYQDLQRYTAVRHNEPNGKVSLPPDEVARGLREFDSKAGPQASPDGPSHAYKRKRNRFIPDFTETSVDIVDSRNAEETQAATVRKAHESSQKQDLAEAKNQQSTTAEATAEVMKETEATKSSHRLTGTYARDFPEEFATSGSSVNSPSRSTLFPKDKAEAFDPLAEASVVDEDGAEVGSMDESFPVENSRLQPVLDRCQGSVSKDTHSTEPQGLQTSFLEECGRSTMLINEKHYKSREPESVSYKILAYDPSSQTMNVAEASALSGDDAPMTLSDALLQLSSPAKFLPHFKPLQAQGYEVVSGSGDVLIFRKVRAGTASDAGLEGMAATYPTRVNPIDMMGRSAIGSFASPTGFVNYETLSESRDRPAPPYGSIANSRNSVSKKGLLTKQRKKRRLGRKLALGTVGIAGSAYVVAVTAEYLSTKGLDPERPRQRRL
ncbi:hypothetical protein FZEAL_3896 [Fusarium zealandicum]|uniref:Uncharacterized protein n=1 Tax=Fusarium zealandicum TaxID=1053134 RepID=A0A8H4XM03_9HYPO|nr:hypothetical protein FZEAL_3896 [Fusarium zealandicum]